MIIKFQVLIACKLINKAFSNKTTDIIIFLLKLIFYSKIMTKYLKIGIWVSKRFNINLLLNFNKILIKIINNNNIKIKEIINKA